MKFTPKDGSRDESGRVPEPGGRRYPVLSVPEGSCTNLLSLSGPAVGEDEFVNKMLWQGEKNFPLRSAYGGQVVGQALMAACHTITDPELLLISAHCYFLSPVKTNERVTYRITCTKDGRFFSSRSVQALQGGKVVSHTLASFKRLETNPHCLSHSPPGIPPGIFPPDDPQQDQEQLYFNNRLELSTSPINAYYCFRKIDQEKLLAREPLPPKLATSLVHRSYISIEFSPPGCCSG